VLVVTRPSRGRVAAAGGIAAALWVIRWLYAEPDPAQVDSLAEQAFYMTAAFVGAGALALLAWDPPARERGVGPVEIGGTFTVAALGLLADRWFRFMVDNPLPSLDRLLFALDDRLGFHAGFFAGELFAAAPPVAFVATTVYRMLPVMLAIAFITLPPALRPRLLVQTSAAGIIGYYLYRLCPAAGPIYAFPDLYPSMPPVVTAGWVQATAMPSSLLNAFPSLHTTWAILAVAWAAFVPPRPRLVIGAMAALTVLATLGLGEHYLVDLAAAVPFAVAFDALFTPRALSWRRRAACIAACVLLVAAWIAGVRTGALLAWDAWAFRAFVVATVVIPPLIARR
jgi:hypothetical protein